MPPAKTHAEIEESRYKTRLWRLVKCAGLAFVMLYLLDVWLLSIGSPAGGHFPASLLEAFSWKLVSVYALGYGLEALNGGGWTFTGRKP
jgi:hypothetical protein